MIVRACLLWALMGASALAQPAPELVVDLTTTRNLAQPVGSWVDIGAGRALFVADSAEEGPELWLATEDPPGAVMLEATVPGPEGLITGRLWRAGSFVYHVQRDGPGEWSLWSVHVGTLVRSRLATFPFSVVIAPSRFFAAGDRVYFGAVDAATNRIQVWTSDGTRGGTVRLTGDLFSQRSTIESVAVAPAGVLAVVMPHRIVTDGTVAGTRSVSIFGENPTIVWRGDGQAFVTISASPATVQGFALSTLFPVTLSPGPVSDRAAGTSEGIFYIASGGIIRTQGTQASTAAIGAITELAGFSAQGLDSVNDRLVIVATGAGTRLVARTAASTATLIDLPAGMSVDRGAPLRLPGVDGLGERLAYRVLTATGTGTGGGPARDWLITDGTPAGTYRLASPIEGRRLFNAGAPIALGAELIRFRHTAAGGRVVGEAFASRAGSADAREVFRVKRGAWPSALPRYLGTIGSSLALTLQTGDEGVRVRLIRSAAAGGGAGLDPAAIATGVQPTDPTLVAQTAPLGEDRLLFVEHVPRGVSVWRLRPDQTLELAARLEGLRLGGDAVVATSGRVSFVVWTMAGGAELWTTDGTGAGTRRLMVLAPGGQGLPARLYGRVRAGAVERLIVLSGPPLSLLRVDPLSGDVETLSAQVTFVTRLSGAVTVRPGDSSESLLMLVGRWIGASNSRAIERIDAAGPMEVVSSQVLTQLGIELVACGEGAFFLDWPSLANPAGVIAPPFVASSVQYVPGSFSTNSAWVSGPWGAARGTAGGVQLQTLAGPVVTLLATPGAAALSGGVALASGRVVAGLEQGTPQVRADLLVSDGTAAGTGVMDRSPAENPAGPRGFWGLDGAGTGRAYFQAASAGRGVEPWVTDGTVGGTRRLGDVYPGARGSFADSFFRLGGRVYFFGEAPGVGYELHGVSVCRVDVDGDGAAGIEDVFVYLARWFEGRNGADYNGSGVVNIDDLLLFVQAWMSGC